MGYKADDKCIKNAFPDERLFVLMARDEASPYVVLEWIKCSIGNQPPEKLHEALDCAIEMYKRQPEFEDRKRIDNFKKEGKLEFTCGSATGQKDQPKHKVECEFINLKDGSKEPPQEIKELFGRIEKAVNEFQKEKQGQSKSGNEKQHDNKDVLNKLYENVTTVFDSAMERKYEKFPGILEKYKVIRAKQNELMAMQDDGSFAIRLRAKQLMREVETLSDELTAYIATKKQTKQN